MNQMLPATSNQNSINSSGREHRFSSFRHFGFLTPTSCESSCPTRRPLQNVLRSFSVTNSPVTSHKSPDIVLSGEGKSARCSSRGPEKSGSNGKKPVFPSTFRNTETNAKTQRNGCSDRLYQQRSDVDKTADQFLHKKFFNKLRWRARRSTHSTSVSEGSSPILGQNIPERFDSLSTSPDRPYKSSFYSEVRLIDTRITKGQNGFGITLAEVLTFISSRLLGLHVPTSLHPDRVGFYQRLLQIRHVAENLVVYSGQSEQHTPVRPGDILLAIGKHRLAGCSPEYAVRLLSGVSVGDTVNITLLRGVSLAPIDPQPFASPFAFSPAHSPPSHTFFPSSSQPVCLNYCELTTNLKTSQIHNLQSQLSCSIPTNVGHSEKDNEDSAAINAAEADQLLTTVSVGELLCSNECYRNTSCLATTSPDQRIAYPANPVTTSFSSYETLPEGTDIIPCASSLSGVTLSSLLDGNVVSAAVPQRNLILPVTQYSVMPLLVCARGEPSNHSKNPNGSKTNGSASDMSDTIPTSVPLQSGIQGVGKSGPCETPDFVPASRFILQSELAYASSPETINSFGSYPNMYSTAESRLAGGDETPNATSPGTCCSSKTTTSYKDFEVTLAIMGAHCGLQICESMASGSMVGVKSVDLRHVPNQSVVPKVGDLLLAVEGSPVINKPLSEVKALLQHHTETSPTKYVRVWLRRISQLACNSPPNRIPARIKFRSFQTKQNTQLENLPGVTSATFDVVLERKENEGFGFVIVSPLNSCKASEIGRIIPNSPADQSKMLKVGYRILAINGERLAGMHHSEIVHIIRQNQRKLVLTVQRPPSPTNNNDTKQDSKSNGTDLPKDLLGSVSCSKTPDDQIEYARMNSCKTSNLNTFSKENGTALRLPVGQLPLLYYVNLTKGAEGFGFSIRGGIDFGRIPLFVFRIADGGPTSIDGRIQIGDEIVEINGVPTHTMTHREAVDAIQQSGQHLKMLLSRQSSKLNEATV
ncbi:Membrane-associated guanylate kinase, WW and PDZ domain-containing protein 1 [Clonorchis sinensis]|uniref:Membrane-associated guanylate kinase, WW and PDZ domain-containing protein 1 n=1 Tax=Clonorchis sinensis TaxID=79923 RepID=A0A8T1MIN6_CLOSI|nr:Membrane-associated guanylate kinase, WW and PDZ domain-containing protein 1 [Clonorchis sinensis]